MKKNNFIILILSVFLGLTILTGCQKKSKPSISIYNVAPGLNFVTFDMRVDDKGAFITEIEASVYKGESKVQTLKASSGDFEFTDSRNVRIEGLEWNTQYICRFHLNYFINDAQVNNYLAKSFEFTTLSLSSMTNVDFSNINNSNGTFAFDYIINSGGLALSDLSISLSNNTQVLKTLTEGLSISEQTSCQFTNLLPSTQYKISFTVSIDYAHERYTDVVIHTHEFMTTDFQYEPRITFANISLTQDEIKFNVNITDQFSFLQNARVELYYNQALLDTISLSLSSNNNNLIFNLLEPGNNYLMKIIANYSINGVNTNEKVMASHDFNTGAYQYLPQATLSSFAQDDDSITAEILIQDQFSFLTDIRLDLLNDQEEVLQTIDDEGDDKLDIGSNTITFTQLPSLSSFTIKVIADYTTNKGVSGEDVVLLVKDFTTDDYQYIPTVELTDLSNDDAEYTAIVTIEDQFNFLTDIRLDLIDDNELVVASFDETTTPALSVGTNELAFPLLTPESDFVIKVTASYSTDRGLDAVDAELLSHSFTTDDYQYLPVASISASTVQRDKIEIMVDIEDQYGFIEDCKMIVYSVVSSSEVLFSTHALVSGENQVNLQALPTDGDYIAKVFVDYEVDGDSFTDVLLDSYSFSTGTYNFEATPQVTFDDNGVISDSYASVVSTPYAEVVLPSPHKPGYKVTWNTQSNGTGTSYDSGSTLTLDLVSIDLYAIAERDYNYATAGLTFTPINTNECSVSLGGATEKTIYIPEEYNDLPVTKIADNGFQNSAIEKIYMASSITHFNQRAFSGCTSLTDVIFEKTSTLTSIGLMAFENCTALTNFVLPDSATSIEFNAFYNCTGIADIYISGNMITLGAGVFTNWTASQKIHVPFASTDPLPSGWPSFWITGSNATIIYTDTI